MGKGKKGGGAKDKSAKSKGKSHPNNLNTVYTISGDTIKQKNKSCPKCGAGVFLASHKDRNHCGKCGYMEKL